MLTPAIARDVTIKNASKSRSSWLMTGSNLDPSFGGISSAVRCLSEALIQHGSCRLSLAAFSEKETKPSCAANSNNRGGVLHECHLPLAHAPWVQRSSPWRTLYEQTRAVDGVHIHGIWQKHCSLSAHAARRLGKPYIISAHGMLDRWALGNKRWKKTIFSALIENRNLRHAACLHALTTVEAADYKKIAPNVPVAVIPNGVRVHRVAPTRFLDEFPELKGKSIVLFLGRIHFKKGLDILCRAWASVSRKYPEAHLVLAGPDFEETRASVEALVDELRITRHVSFTGMLSGDMKWSALASAKYFVLPSYSEGFSVAVLEALGIGLPVIVSQQCNIPQVSEKRCGWIIQPRTEELQTAIEDALSTRDQSRSAMGSRAMQLVAERFSWDVVAEQMSAVYEWALGAAKPAFVEGR